MYGSGLVLILYLSNKKIKLTHFLFTTNPITIFFYLFNLFLIFSLDIPSLLSKPEYLLLMYFVCPGVLLAFVWREFQQLNPTVSILLCLEKNKIDLYHLLCLTAVSLYPFQYRRAPPQFLTIISRDYLSFKKRKKKK